MPSFMNSWIEDILTTAVYRKSLLQQDNVNALKKSLKNQNFEMFLSQRYV